MDTIFVELSLIIIVAAAISVIMWLLRQPLIIGYLVTGILVGPSFFNLVQSQDAITTFAEIGVTLLLFMVGLNLNPRVIKEFGPVSLYTGIGQFLITAIVGFILMRVMHFDLATSIYIAIALTFSSTIIILKLLSDKNELETLYGRITIGFLIVQDLIAILVIIIITAMAGEKTMSELIFSTILKGIGLIVIITLISMYVLPRTLKHIAQSQEFLFLFGIGWTLALATVFNYFEFSKEIGALIAGISLSMSSYRYEISSRLKPLRDFFIILFFILLGSRMIMADIITYIWPAIILSAFLLIGTPFILLAIMGVLGYTKRTGFFIGMAVSQVSEFSFILIALGVTFNHLENGIISFITMIGLFTIAGSAYFIKYSNKIYAKLAPFLQPFEQQGTRIDQHHYHKEKGHEVILFGHNRIGYDLLESFRKMKRKLFVVDYNPETIITLTKQHVDCMYGDASDPELLTELNFKKAKMIVSTIPDLETNTVLIKAIRGENKKSIIIVVSHQIDEALALYEAGATYVIMPHFLGGKYTSGLIEDTQFDFKRFLKHRNEHIKHLKKRKDIGHEHPTHHRS